MLWSSQKLIEELKSLNSSLLKVYREVAAISDYLDQINKTYKETNYEILNQLKQIRFMISRPIKPTLNLLKEQDMDNIVFSVKLGAPKAADVVKRRVEVTVNSVPLFNEYVDVTETEIGPFGGEEGSTVTVTVVDVDNAGNESQPVVLTDTLKDVFSPPAPDASIVLLREEFVVEPEQEEVVEPVQDEETSNVQEEVDDSVQDNNQGSENS